MSIEHPKRPDPDPDSRWTVRGPADDPAALLHRAAEFVGSLAIVADCVERLSFHRDGDDVILTVAFDHWRLPADLDYLDPRVAPHPGHGDYPRDDIEFMVALALDLGAHTVVDFGCGWGRLAVRLAEGARRVIGVDPAKAMLDIAREREGHDLVEWIWGDIRALRERDVDLVVMTGNIPSIYVTDEAWDEVLAGVHAALRPGGHLAFGGWNPGARRWEAWGPRIFVLQMGDGKGVRVGDLGGGLGMELAEGREWLAAGSEWRYRTQEEFASSLADHGFEVEQCYGDWQRSPLTPDSPDIVVVARRRENETRGAGVSAAG